MHKVIKSKKNIVQAWRLGDHSEMEQKMLKEGKIRRTPEGRYELFSQEAVNGKGELADEGDYFKVDSSEMPYPNDYRFFIDNHKKIGEDTYEQKPRILEAWKDGDPVGEEIEFLLKTEKLQLNPASQEKYFEAFLHETHLSAAKDAVLVIRWVERDSAGKITDIEFDFIAGDEFEKTYRYVE